MFFSFFVFLVVFFVQNVSGDSFFERPGMEYTGYAVSPVGSISFFNCVLIVKMADSRLRFAAFSCVLLRFSVLVCVFCVVLTFFV